MSSPRRGGPYQFEHKAPRQLVEIACRIEVSDVKTIHVLLREFESDIVWQESMNTRQIELEVSAPGPPSARALLFVSDCVVR